MFRFKTRNNGRTFWFNPGLLSVAPIVVGFATACAKQDPDVVAGEAIFNQTCKACHASGLNGAPIVGNVKMWQPRIDQGIEILAKHASEGYELMPAKGGNTDLSDEQIMQAVKYFVSQLEEK